jgi:hypothetical protein
MAGDIGRLQPDMQWRDFWGTDDPAPSGRPAAAAELHPGHVPAVHRRARLQPDVAARGPRRLLGQRRALRDPAAARARRPTGDRGASRFYSDDAESYLRSRRKERVGLLALWRRALLSLPLVAIVAAATVSAPGFVPTLGAFALQLFGLIPGNQIVGQAAAAFVDWIAGLSTEGVPLIPNALQFDSLLTPLYTLGTWALEAILIALLANALLPGQIDRLWSNPERGATPRFVLLVVDYAVGVGAFAMVVAGFFILLTAEQRAAIWEGSRWGRSSC